MGKYYRYTLLLSSKESLTEWLGLRGWRAVSKVSSQCKNSGTGFFEQALRPLQNFRIEWPINRIFLFAKRDFGLSSRLLFGTKNLSRSR